VKKKLDKVENFIESLVESGYRSLVISRSLSELKHETPDLSAFEKKTRDLSALKHETRDLSESLKHERRTASNDFDLSNDCGTACIIVSLFLGFAALGGIAICVYRLLKDREKTIREVEMTQLQLEERRLQTNIEEQRHQQLIIQERMQQINSFRQRQQAEKPYVVPVGRQTVVGQPVVGQPVGRQLDVNFEKQ
jgi:hypothetical protein